MLTQDNPVNVKKILNDLHRAKLIDCDASGALERIQEGREVERTPLFAELTTARQEGEVALHEIAERRMAAEAMVEDLKQKLHRANCALAELRGAESALEVGHSKRVGMLERQLRELADPILALLLNELQRLRREAQVKFRSAELRTKDVFGRRTTEVVSNALPIAGFMADCTACLRAVEELQVSPRPDDFAAALRALTAPVSDLAEELAIATRWPWEVDQ